MNDIRPNTLDDEERAIYQWQMWMPGLGEEGQRKLKSASVMVSRCGGVGGAAATYLAAAGVGRLLIAHAGDVRPSDLHRQTLMTHDWIGKPRVESIRRRLQAMNPRVQVDTVAENVTPKNADKLVSSVDLVIDAAPLFQERQAMNASAVRFAKPMVEAAMYDMEVQVTLVVPGQTPCVACRFPGVPDEWKRQFPVLGSVAATAGTLAATEAIKWITGIGEPLAGRLLTMDLRSMQFRTLKIRRDPNCAVCGML